jgi:hypothetical protein
MPQTSGYSDSTPPPRFARFGLCFGADPVFSLIPSHLPLSLRSPRTFVAIGVAATAAAGLATYVLTRKRPTAEELERERRDLLARTGRITDGTIMDTMINEVSSPGTSSAPDAQPDDAVPTPHIIVYNYRIAGVTYECAQDVTTLAEHVRGIRSDLPIQVRYAPQNPANSIVVADSWSGLRLTSSHPHSTEAGASERPRMTTDQPG